MEIIQLFFLDSNCCQQKTDLREYFLAIVYSQILNKSKYYSQSSESRDTLTKVLQQVSDLDPEFILQVAYYVRHNMYLRSVYNFILAFATLNKNTKRFCDKYFGPTLLIPGDLIEVCQYVQVIRAHDKDLNLEKIEDIRKKLNFPKILQKQIKKKLRQYSIYQLGKQCSDASRKKNLQIYKQKLYQLPKDRRKEIKNIKDLQRGPDEQQAIEQKLLKATGKLKKCKKPIKKKQILKEMKNKTYLTQPLSFLRTQYNQVRHHNHNSQWHQCWVKNILRLLRNLKIDFLNENTHTYNAGSGTNQRSLKQEGDLVVITSIKQCSISCTHQKPQKYPSNQSLR